MDTLIELLEAKRLELVFQIDRREDIQVEKHADPMDVSTSQAQRDAAAGNINRATRLLYQVNSALQRARTGSYGRCVECEEDIPKRRLVAVPWAARCIPCQEAEDNYGVMQRSMVVMARRIATRDNERSHHGKMWGNDLNRPTNPNSVSSSFPRRTK